jgi:hypothetical protein
VPRVRHTSLNKIATERNIKVTRPWTKDGPMVPRIIRVQDNARIGPDVQLSTWRQVPIVAWSNTEGEEGWPVNLAELELADQLADENSDLIVRVLITSRDGDVYAPATGQVRTALTQGQSTLIRDVAACRFPLLDAVLDENWRVPPAAA